MKSAMTFLRTTLVGGLLVNDGAGAAALGLHHRLEELPLVGEVAVERRLGGAGDAGDLVDAGAFVAAVHEDLARPLQHLGGRARLDVAGVARVPVVDLLLALAAREPHLLRVHHDDEVAVVGVRREGRAMLAAQQRRDARREAAQRLVGGVHDPPARRDVGRFQRPRRARRTSGGHPGLLRVGGR